MLLPLSNRWVTLSIADSFLQYSDERGIQRRFTADVDLNTERLDSPQLWETLRGILSSPIQRTGPHANGPIPLAVFIKSRNLVTDHSWERIFETSWRDFAKGDPETIQIVHLLERLPMRRPPFRLPLRILATSPTASNVVNKLRKEHWFTPDVAQFGLQLRTTDLPIVFADLDPQEQDIVIATDDSVSAVRKACIGVRRPRSRPRLIIHVGETEHKELLEPHVLKSGISLLYVPGDIKNLDSALFVKDFVYGIIHDYPLHEALKAARRYATIRGQSKASEAALFADPRSNQDLRISDAAMSLHHEAISLSQSAAAGRPDIFVKTARQDIPPGLHQFLSGAAGQMAPIQTAVQQTRRLRADFGQETTGLVPMSEAKAALSAARVAHRKVVSKIKSTIDPFSFDLLRKEQKRRVDIALEHLNEMGIYEIVEPIESLRHSNLYRLRVHIGHPLLHSLIVGDVPEIDPLLPETSRKQGHWLQVAVFSKDFQLRSTTFRRFYLPPLGGSRPIYFEIAAPDEGDSADLRVCVYHKNHLLQSFLMSAQLGPGLKASKRQIEIRLEFSQTAKFTNLDQLKPRALSVGVNQNGAMTHAFMFKDDVQARSIHLSESVLEQQIAKFRKMLAEASCDATTGLPRFETYPSPGAAASASFQTFIRNLASTGSSLYQALFVRAPKALQDRLRVFSKARDQTVQVIRYDPTYTFPWTAIYDYELPQDPNAAICLGLDQSSGQSDRPCNHGPNCSAYCINGFWAIRHRVEQLVSNGGDPQDTPGKVMVPSPNDGGVRLAVGTPDEHTTKLAQDLAGKLGTALIEMQSGEDLLDLLWKIPGRPAILIVVGHLARTGQGAAQIQLPGAQWLSAPPITARHIRAGDWEQPRTVVLLMACGSGATDVSTLNDFVTAFSAVGAAAVVSTECLAFTRLVARFASEITADLWSDHSLGEAIQQFNRRMVQAGNPLAFVFSCLGDIDLTLIK